MGIRGRFGVGLGLAAVGIGLFVPAGSSAVEIHAHRGGSNIEGQAAFGENSMSAFRHSAEAGFVIELDLGQTSDGVAVVMHDDDLDRTTNCEGEVAEHIWADLVPCRIDRIGAGDVREYLEPGDPRLEPIPTLAQVIDLLKETGSRANIEVKNFGPTGLEFPRAVYSQLAASGLPSSQVIVQNFGASNLKEAPALYPGVEISKLSVHVTDEFDLFAVDTATDLGAEWTSPQWPITADFVTRAHEARLKIVPWTIDDPADLTAAAGLGVDAVITDDPTLADRLIGPKPSLKLKLVKGPKRKRPGGTIRPGAFVFNSGEGQSDPGARVKIKFSRKSLKPVGRVSKVLPALKLDEEYDTNFRVKVRRRAKKFGKFPVTFRFTQAGKPTIKKVFKVKVLRPRK
ncbi:MAG: hypothetical protein IPK93_06205 [Solirubrobacterales bacterium]|nr:hypothetical protein [Solirubrobacterales bacterium]